MSKVVIFGSKPNPSIKVISKKDIVVFVNGSIVSSDFVNCFKKIHVISDYIIKDNKGHLVKAVRDNMKDKKTDELVVIDSSRKAPGNDEIKLLLDNIGYETTYTTRVRLNKKNKYFFKGLGFSYFLLIKEIGVKSFVYEALRFIVKMRPSKKIKPSTGVIAYIHMKLQYPDKEIVCIGVGLDSDGYSYTNCKYDRGHQVYDKIYISKNYLYFLDV